MARGAPGRRGGPAAGRAVAASLLDRFAQVLAGRQVLDERAGRPPAGRHHGLMRLDVDQVRPDDWAELAAALHRCGFTTDALRAALGLTGPADNILRSTARFSFFYLDRLPGLEGPFPVLARLFMLRARVPAEHLDRLGDDLAGLLRRTGLVEATPQDPAAVRATAGITEVRGRLFLSDPLFENTGTDIDVHDTTGRCMPPHASSLELLGALQGPAGATSFLDVGCGSGCQPVLFAAGHTRTAGFDPGPRQVSFARANARLNGVATTYTVDRWETFVPQERFDHVAFNTPTADMAFAFVNGNLDKVLAPSGVAQLWFITERGTGERDWEQHVARRVTLPVDWDVRIDVHAGSPFAAPESYVADGRLPAGTLLVEHPSKTRAYIAGLRDRGVCEVASMTLTVGRRALRGRAGADRRGLDRARRVPAARRHRRARCGGLPVQARRHLPLGGPARGVDLLLRGVAADGVADVVRLPGGAGPLRQDPARQRRPPRRRRPSGAGNSSHSRERTYVYEF
jgi:SAM-dependent methyltransferase